jgi:hypothetical protein
LVGTTGGVVVGIGAGVAFGLLLGEGTTAGPDGGPDHALFTLVLAIGLGIWLGAALGCWIGLRLRRHAGAGQTAALLALIGPLWSFAVGGLLAMEALTSWLGPLARVGAAVVDVAVLSLAPLAARALTLWLRAEPLADL